MCFSLINKKYFLENYCSIRGINKVSKLNIFWPQSQLRWLISTYYLTAQYAVLISFVKRLGDGLHSHWTKIGWDYKCFLQNQSKNWLSFQINHLLPTAKVTFNMVYCASTVAVLHTKTQKLKIFCHFSITAANFWYIQNSFALALMRLVLIGHSNYWAGGEKNTNYKLSEQTLKNITQSTDIGVSI